jgi:hypothetical protein
MKTLILLVVGLVGATGLGMTTFGMTTLDRTTFGMAI